MSNAFSLCKAASFVVAEGIIDEAPRDEEVNGRLIAPESDGCPAWAGEAAPPYVELWIAIEGLQ